MQILLVEAQMTSSPSRLKDGAVNLKFQSLQEISNQEFSLMDQYYRQNGHLAFKLDEIDIDEIPDINTKIKGQKSRSQQQRMKLFALHMKKGGSKSDFTPFYERQMDRIDRALQDELDQIED